MPRRLLLPLSILLALAASACQVRTTVDVGMAEDGSGEVAVMVRLDAEALARVPDVDGDGTSGLADLAELVRTEDLVAAGWTVGEPTESGEGGAALRVTRPFGTPDEADTILAELTGPSGVLRDLDVSRSTSFPSAVAVTAASSATGRSLVPAVTIRIVPRPRGAGSDGARNLVE